MGGLRRDSSDSASGLLFLTQ